MLKRSITHTFAHVLRWPIDVLGFSRPMRHGRPPTEVPSFSHIALLAAVLLMLSAFCKPETASAASFQALNRLVRKATATSGVSATVRLFTSREPFPLIKQLEAFTNIFSSTSWAKGGKLSAGTEGVSANSTVYRMAVSGSTFATSSPR